MAKSVISSYTDLDFTLVEATNPIKKTQKTAAFSASTSFRPMQIAPKFQKDSLKKQFEKTVSHIKSIPIEHFEIKLFKITQNFHENLGGIPFEISFFNELHHLVRLQQNCSNLNGTDRSILEEKMIAISLQDPYVYQKYKITCNLFKFCSCLMVKWGIFKPDNYDFRCNGRVLNVKMLDLEELNTNIMLLEMLWLTSAIFKEPLINIAQAEVLEMGKIFRAAVDELFPVLLKLNSYNPTYKIKKIVAFNCENYKKFKKTIIPEENLEHFQHQKLEYKKGFFAKCFLSNPVLDDLFNRLTELELIYRSFEKELIKCLLSATGFKNYFVN